MRTPRFTLLATFLYVTALLALVIVLYIISLVLISLVTGSLHVLITFLQLPCPHIPPLVTTSLISLSIILTFFH